MARIRTIKPEFFTSLTIADLTLEERLTFIGLWTHVDDYGRCIDDERLVKAAVWPLDDRTSGEIREDLRSLHKAGLILLYEASGRRYLQVNAWAEHQRVSHPTPSRFPEPDRNGLSLLTSADDEHRDTSGKIPEDDGNPPDIFVPERNREQGTGNREKDTRAQQRAKESRFDEFYEIYPKHVGRADAVRKWVKAVKATDPELIIEGARRYRDNPTRNPDYTKNPATWLNQECWLDGSSVTPPPGGYRQATNHDRLKHPNQQWYDNPELGVTI